MTWQAPWAFAGFALLALPILIHLLSRTRAVVQRFPTLRFLDVARLLPTRSPRITDIPLLLVRLAVLAMATLALAGPLWNSANRKRALNGALARAVIVDTSRSVLARSSTMRDSARSNAERLAAEAQTSTIIESTRPTHAIAGASAWLATQRGRSEIVVLSDFQASSIDSATLAAIPTHIGVTLVRLGLAGASTQVQSNSFQTSTSNVSVSQTATATTATWVPSAAESATSPVLAILTAPGDSLAANAALEAAMQVAAAPLADSSKLVTVLFAGAPNATALLANAKPLRAQWMASFVERLVASDLFASSIASAPLARDSASAASLTTVARTPDGAPLVSVASSTSSGHDNLVLYVRMPPASVSAATLLGAVLAARGADPFVSELDAATMSNATITQLQRAPGNVATVPASNLRDASTGESDAPWFWVAALLLLVIEAVMRRNTNTPPLMETAS